MVASDYFDDNSDLTLLSCSLTFRVLDWDIEL